MNLQPYIKQIKELNPLSQRLFYNIEHWKNYNFNNQTILDDIEIITNEFRNGISRQEIIDFIGQNQDNLRMGFILTMIWGHGFSEHGKADNRGPWKVSQMLENLSKSEDILLNANNCLNNHDFKGAHNEFKDMKRCRVNFFSKFLYFLGRAKEMDCYPLIFDARVAYTIGILSSSNQSLISILDIQPKQDAHSFDLYIKQIHGIGKKYKIEAEKIEYFLFKGV